MCAPSQGAMLPYGLKVPAPYFPFGPTGSLTQAHLSTLDFQNSQLNDYNVRVQLGLRNYQNSLGLSPFHAYITDPYTQAYFYKHDPRARFVQEEPKPSHSYIGLIGMAILNSKEKKLVLSDIYQWILDNYPYFRTRGPGWRNSIRHNLSLNDCFIKSGRSANGKGHYWAVHPANVDDFERGDFRRRRAQRKVRRHMGLSVPDDDDSPTASPIQRWPHHDATQDPDRNQMDSLTSSDDHVLASVSPRSESDHLILLHQAPIYGHVPVQPRKQSRKRLFDMASLLAPDDDDKDGKSDDRSYSDTCLQDINTAQHDQDAKKEDNKLTQVSDSIKDNVDSNINDDVDMNVSHLSSDSDRELDVSDDDDCEQEEIQVTSEDDSPEQQLDKKDLPVRDIYVNMKNRNGGEVHTQRQDHKLLKWSSSGHKVKSKTGRLLNSSPLAQSDSEHKVDMFSHTHESKVLGLHFGKKSDIFQQRMGIEPKENLIQKYIKENFSNYTEVKAANNPTAVTQSKSSKYCGNSQKTACQASQLNQPEFREEMPPAPAGSLDHVTHVAEEGHYYRSEMYETQLKTRQDNGYSQFSAKDNHNRQNQTDTSRPVSDTPVSDSRLPNDHRGWFEMSNGLITRDRMCTFSLFGIKNPGMYSQIESRNAYPNTPRLAPVTSSVNAETSTALTSLSSLSSLSATSVAMGLDTAVAKSCHTTASSNLCSSLHDSTSGRLET